MTGARIDVSAIQIDFGDFKLLRGDKRALAAIDRMRVSDESQDPAVRRSAAVAERDRLAADIRAKFADSPENLGMFEAAMKSSAIFLSGRERGKRRHHTSPRVLVAGPGGRGSARDKAPRGPHGARP